MIHKEDEMAHYLQDQFPEGLGNVREGDYSPVPFSSSPAPIGRDIEDGTERSPRGRDDDHHRPGDSGSSSRSATVGRDRESRKSDAGADSRRSDSTSGGRSGSESGSGNGSPPSGAGR
jgi:hypothetical protein